MQSQNEHFEKAEIIQKKIDAILYVTNPIYQKFDYRADPNLDADLRNKELLSLKECLNKNNLQVKRLERIECFDISNIGGEHASGSMVVFVNGEKEASQYRKFRIKNLPTFPNLPNDFSMMQQILSRRLNHKEWPFPDLIIVDGGKGQVSAALKAIKGYNKDVNNLTIKQPACSAGGFNNRIICIPIIGLAKREETIVVPLTLLNRHSGNPSADGASRISNNSESLPAGRQGFWTSQNDDRGSFKEISLPKDSPALHLIMRIRDEAHRFAISYHRKLRSKSLIPNT